ncbi:MAG: cobalamin-binding protein [Candidatus Rokuibacteriota bacterium]|nr:MAG: cobalamin-binding protein [Candidatus Rokubacteria bacterium]
MRALVSVLVSALLLVLTAAAPAAALTIHDMAGRPVTLAGSPRRIVSLVPSATEIIFALGADDRLVGVTDYCDFPAAAKGKPSVGGMVNPSLETIVKLKPELVVATREGNREETFEDLSRLGIPVFLVEAAHVSDVMTVVRRLAELTERTSAAPAVVAALTRRIDAVRRAVAPLRRPRVLYVVWPEPLIVPAREALVTELIQLAGGDSISAGDRGSYPRFSLESAIARHPEIIVLASHGTGSAVPAREKWERFTALAGGRAARIEIVDGNLLHRYGPRVVDGLEQLARAIHPEAFR